MSSVRRDEARGAEAILPAVKAAAAVLPGHRMVVLVAWAEVSADGKNLDSGYDVYRVSNVLVATTEEGAVLTQPVFVCDGRLVTLAEAEALHFPAAHRYEVVDCDWRRHEDRQRLRGRVKLMLAQAEKEALASRRPEGAKRGDETTP